MSNAVLCKMDIIEKQFKDIEGTINTFSEFLGGDEIIKISKSLAKRITEEEVSRYAPNRIGSIKVTGISKNLRIYSNDPVLIYNEYGTGIAGLTGKNKSGEGYGIPHPEAGLVGWQYMSNPAKNYEMGWRYPKDDGTFGWTMGLPARMGFYRARNRIYESLPIDINIKIKAILDEKHLY